MRDHCCVNLRPSIHCNLPERARQFDDVLKHCQKLDIFLVRGQLLEFLRTRPRKHTSNLELPATWNMSEEDDIVEAITIIGRNGKNAKVHCAFAQMKLFSLIEKRVANGKNRLKVTGKRNKTVVAIEELAIKGAEGECDKWKRNLIRSRREAYFGGKRWNEVCEYFGGTSTVLVFVTAGQII